jgi:hypothetical protein
LPTWVISIDPHRGEAGDRSDIGSLKGRALLFGGHKATGLSLYGHLVCSGGRWQPGPSPVASAASAQTAVAALLILVPGCPKPTTGVAALEVEASGHSPYCMPWRPPLRCPPAPVGGGADPGLVHQQPPTRPRLRTPPRSLRGHHPLGRHRRHDPPHHPRATRPPTAPPHLHLDLINPSQTRSETRHRPQSGARLQLMRYGSMSHDP